MKNKDDLCGSSAAGSNGSTTAAPKPTPHAAWLQGIRDGRYSERQREAARTLLKMIELEAVTSAMLRVVQPPEAPEPARPEVMAHRQTPETDQPKGMRCGNCGAYMPILPETPPYLIRCGRCGFEWER